MNLQFILSCVYFFLPAYFTNMTPPLVAKVGIFNFLAKPIDSGKTLYGRPILGSHKTWRGAVFGIIIGTSVGEILFFLNDFLNLSFYQTIGFQDYGRISGFLFGFLLSSGAVFGDLSFAFIKRRLKLESGAPFLPFDQINYVIGAFLFLTPFFKIDIIAWIAILVLTFFLHIIFNRLGYNLKINKAKW